MILLLFFTEQKPSWRQHFDRKDLSDSELIDDREVIANMKLVNYFSDKKSYVQIQISRTREQIKRGKKGRINTTDPERSDYAGKIQN